MELEKCFRCGSSELIKNWENRGVWYEREGYTWGNHAVICSKCYFYVEKNAYSPEDAISYWNNVNKKESSLKIIILYAFIFVMFLIILLFLGN